MFGLGCTVSAWAEAGGRSGQSAAAAHGRVAVGATVRFFRLCRVVGVCGAVRAAPSGPLQIYD